MEQVSMRVWWPCLLQVHSARQLQAGVCDWRGRECPPRLPHLQGTHAELLQLPNGQYARLVQAQSTSTQAPKQA